MKKKTDHWQSGQTCALSAIKTASTLVDKPVAVSDPDIQDISSNNAGKISYRNKRSLQCAASKAVELSNLKRRRLAESENAVPVTHLNINHLIPIGCLWNDNSCAYDTVITMLYNIWLDCPPGATFPEMKNILFRTCVKNFAYINHSQERLVELREYVRRYLHDQRPSEFTYGSYASVCSLLEMMMEGDNNTSKITYECVNGHIISRSEGLSTSYMVSAGVDHYDSVQEWLSGKGKKSRRLCVHCSDTVFVKHHYTYPPYFLAFDFNSEGMQINSSVTTIVKGKEIPYLLKAVVYFGRSHFTGRYINSKGRAWMYDGTSNDGIMEYDGSVATDSLSTCRGMTTILIYVRSSAVRLRIPSLAV